MAETITAELNLFDSKNQETTQGNRIKIPSQNMPELDKI